MKARIETISITNPFLNPAIDPKPRMTTNIMSRVFKIFNYYLIDFLQ
jgi:hypothetical protein